MSIRNGWPTAAASRSEAASSLVRVRYAEPDATAPDDTRTTLHPSDRTFSAASSADVSTTGSGPVDRVMELDPILTTIDFITAGQVPPCQTAARRTGAGTGPRT